MRERPILFSGEMVRAILNGRKTQTRRVIKPQPPWWAAKFHEWASDGAMWRGQVADAVWSMRCPYGKPGDHLWVRETWATPGNYDHIKPSALPSTDFDSSLLAYRATEPHGDVYYKWRPSIFMPRWASRITLRVAGVRMERVQDITPEDVESEGLRKDRLGSYKVGSKYYHIPGYAFAALWDSINAKRGHSWESDPWCWVVEFERIGGDD